MRANSFPMGRRLRALPTLGMALAVASIAFPLPLTAAFEMVPGPGAVLRGPDARLQLVVTGDDEASGRPVDLTPRVRYQCEPEGVVEVDSGGFVTPSADGTVRVTAIEEASGRTTSTDLVVESVAEAPRINFPNQVVPVFTKFGCNGGGCHGKVEGQNGFRLSLLGFEPTEDYEYLVKESRGRRIFPAAPEFSLLLRKATGELPHGGGGRMDPDSPPYRTIVRWIEQGMPYGRPDDPVVERIEVFPKERLLAPQESQQVRVTAFYTDGFAEDVTRLVGYETNNPEMAEVTPEGLITVGTQTGNVSVMIRFHELVDVVQLTVPLGAPVDDLPPARNLIDDAVFAKLQTLGMPPSAMADDETFLRRVTLDIAGRLPTPEEVRAFRDDPDPNKRDKRIDALVEDPGYAIYFANKWNALLRNKRPGQPQERGARRFHAWLVQSLRENRPYDEIVGEVVSASGEPSTVPASIWFRNVRDTKEQLQDVAQVFLGIRMQCAQCHHHPYEKWSQQDYYGFEAFFRQVGRKPGEQPGEEIVFHRYGTAQAQNPKTGQNVPPTAPGAAPLEVAPEDDPRVLLAEWMGEPSNPFFARMLVNRYWKHFFGRGLVEPEDDIRVTNPATHPELLERLAAEFAGSGYDLKQLVRTICSSTTYQLASLPNEHNADDRQNYSRFYPRRLPAEVLSDAIDRLTAKETRFDDQPAGTSAVALPDDNATQASYFLSVFGRPEMNSACECERSSNANLAQTLHLLNSKTIQEKLTADDARPAVLARDAERPFRDRLDELYVLALGRAANDEELAIAQAYLERKEAGAGEGEGEEKKTVEQARREAFEDLVWALVNTKEFLYNH